MKYAVYLPQNRVSCTVKIALSMMQITLKDCRADHTDIKVLNLSRA